MVGVTNIGRRNGHSRVNAYVAEWCEVAACVRFCLERADEYICDAYATEDTPLVDAGTPVEIKACCIWIGNGTTPAGTEKRMRGRFTFSPTHDKLVEEGGEYALVLYDTVGDPEGSGYVIVYRIALVSARTIDALISDGPDYPKLSWPHIFESAEPP